MKGGDISNERPSRVVVTLDCILDRKPSVKKALGGLISIPDEEITYSRQSLAYFWHFSEKNEFILELAGFGYTRKDMKQVQEDLDNLGTNPFNYYSSYRVVADLVGELPYRPEVKHVIDIPERALRYGARFLDMGKN